MPTKVAEGYEEVARDELSKHIRIIYVNNNKETMYSYIQQTQDMGQHINTEDTKYEKLDTSYGRAYYCDNEGERQIYWDYGGYVFSILGDISKEEMVKIIDSVQLEKGER